MAAWAAHKRLDAHTIHKCSNVGKKHINGMPYRQVHKAFFSGGIQIFLLCHNWVRPNAHAEQLCIMIVMMVMRALPDVRRRYHVHAKCGKDYIGKERFPQYSMMLVVMEYDKKPG